MIFVGIIIYAGLQISELGLNYCHDPSYCDVIVTRNETVMAGLLFLIGITCLVFPISQSKTALIIGIGMTVTGSGMILLKFLDVNNFINQSLGNIDYVGFIGIIIFSIGIFILVVRGLSHLLDFVQYLRIQQ